MDLNFSSRLVSKSKRCRVLEDDNTKPVEAVPLNELPAAESQTSKRNSIEALEPSKNNNAFPFYSNLDEALDSWNCFGQASNIQRHVTESEISANKDEEGRKVFASLKYFNYWKEKLAAFEKTNMFLELSGNL